MKYGMLPFKVIHFDMPELSNEGGFLDGKVQSTVAHYPKQENQESFMITWRYRLTKDDKPLFSYVGESKFVIHDDGIELEREHLRRLIGDLYLNFQLGWEERKRNTKLHGTNPPTLMPSSIENIINTVVDFLQ